jgi:hypothetical protein
MSATITRPRDGVDRQPIAGPPAKPVEVDLQYIATSNGRSFAEDESTRRRRGRLARYGIFVPLWALGAIPLAREISDGREVVLAYLAVGAASLGVALALRGIYVVLTRRKKIFAPSAFLIAAVLAMASYVVQTGGEEEIPIAGAAAQESEVLGSSG